MSQSDELMIGKAAEHLVCADLLLKGYNAFLSDQGLSYDLVIDKDGVFYRVQVKATTAPAIIKIYDNGKEKRYGRNNTYRFNMRRGTASNNRHYDSGLCDLYAFIALDIMKIAYMQESTLTRNDKVISGVEFRSRLYEYPGRVYSNGTIRQGNWGRYIEDFGEVPI